MDTHTKPLFSNILNLPISLEKLEYHYVFTTSSIALRQKSSGVCSKFKSHSLNMGSEHSEEQELLQGKDFVNKNLVIKTEPMDITFETLHVPKDPTERSPRTECIHTVIMQPVASEPGVSLNPFKCDFCGKQFRLASRLKVHAKIHSDTNTDRLSSGDDATRRHKTDKSRRSTKSRFKLKTQKDTKSLANNTNNNKTQTKPKVKLTNLTLKTHKDKKSRVNKTDKTQPTNLRNNKLTTDNGGKSKVNKRDNSKTQSIPNTKLTLNYKCNICKKEFATPAHLSRHTRVHTGIRPYTCEKCNKTFKDASVLTRHLRIHSNDRPYSCKECKKSFIQRKDLQHHVRSHRGDQPYQCETCNKWFSSASYLTVHKRTHTGIKPYVCPVCNAGFQASGTLARHQRSHSAEKQYKCSECPKAFTRSTNLKLHIQAHHGNSNIQA